MTIRRLPDYYTLSISEGFPISAGSSQSITVDWYGNVYAGVGITAGKSWGGILSGSGVAGWIDGYDETPKESVLSSFLAGKSYNVSGGWYIGGGKTYSDETSATELGFYFPKQFGGVRVDSENIRSIKPYIDDLIDSIKSFSENLKGTEANEFNNAIWEQIQTSGYATGGYLESGQIAGSGTGTSDSILAWLGNKGKFIRISNGEYVIRANAVQKWGTNFLDSINNGLIPQEFYNGKSSYATGGSISDDSVKKPQGNLGEAFRNAALTLIQSIQNYAQELIKQMMSGLGLDTNVAKSSDSGTLLNGTNSSQDFGRDANGNTSTVTQQADYNSELAKTPSLLERIHEASKKTFEAGLSNFLTEGIMKSKSLGEAFRNLAISVLQSIQKIYAEAVTKNIMSMLGMGGQTSRPTVNGTAVQGPLKADGTFAEGGHIQGPGTATSDSILARLSNGEFVIKASSVQKYGTNFLHSLNQGFLPSNLMPRFATGGLVGASVEGAAAIASNIQSGDVTVPLKVVNVTDPNEVGRYLKTRSGERIMVNFMKNNAGTMRQILNVRG